jgi:hypothetical protein
VASRPLIAERTARFFLGHGLEHTAYDLLAQAGAQYAAWGATAKAEQLDWAYPALRPPADLPHRRATITASTLDLLGILSASRALKLRDQRRTPARARGRGAQRDDRGHGGPSAAVER